MYIIVGTTAELTDLRDSIDAELQRREALNNATDSLTDSGDAEPAQPQYRATARRPDPRCAQNLAKPQFGLGSTLTLLNKLPAILAEIQAILTAVQQTGILNQPLPGAPAGNPAP